MANKRKKPKIAFSFSGQIRTFDKSYPSLKKNVLTTGSDIFCYADSDDDLVSQKLKPTIFKVCKPVYSKKYENVEKKQDVTYNYRKAKPLSSVKNCFEMYRKIYESFKLCELYAKKKNISYDFIVRIRFDCDFYANIDFQKYFEIDDGKTLYLFKRTGAYATDDSFDDLFAFGSFTVMEKYCKLYSNLSVLIKRFTLNSLNPVESLVFLFEKLFIRFYNLTPDNNFRLFLDKIYFYIFEVIFKKIRQNFAVNSERLLFEQLKGIKVVKIPYSCKIMR